MYDDDVTMCPMFEKIFICVIICSSVTFITVTLWCLMCDV